MGGRAVPTMTTADVAQAAISAQTQAAKIIRLIMAPILHRPAGAPAHSFYKCSSRKRPPKAAATLAMNAPTNMDRAVYRAACAAAFRAESSSGAAASD